MIQSLRFNDLFLRYIFLTFASQPVIEQSLVVHCCDDK